MDGAATNETEETMTVTGVSSLETVGTAVSCSAAIGVSCDSPDSLAKEEAPETEQEILDQHEDESVEGSEEGGAESTEALETSAGQEVGRNN